MPLGRDAAYHPTSAWKLDFCSTKHGYFRDYLNNEGRYYGTD